MRLRVTTAFSRTPNDLNTAHYISPSLLLSLALLIPVSGQGQPAALTPQSNSQLETNTNSELMTFDAPFFRQYNPVTALDMVEQVPGFQIDEGGELRGFGGTAGNILINGERPSTKSDDAGAILGRIPATQVARIDLIRGETGGLNLRGQTVVVDVILREDDSVSTRWEAGIRTTENTSTINPDGKVSRTGRWGLTQYTLGAEAGEARSHQPRGTEQLLIDSQLAERRDEIENSGSESFSSNINTTTQFPNGSTFRFNGRVGNEKTEIREASHRLPLTPNALSRSLLEGSTTDSDNLEVGGDFEFALSNSVMAKAIGLLNRAEISGNTSLQAEDFGQNFLSSSFADRETEEEEIITRFELAWNRPNGHHFEANMERTTNTLDNSLTLFEDEGLGLREVPLPGANTRVEETRWDVEFNYSFSRGLLAIDGGIAFEDSRIEQVGDAANKRSFFFAKPRLMLTYAPDLNRQTRIRLQREVAQLDFNDFVSATNFGDNQFDLGNPELEPESTWVAEVTFERRFGEIGAINLTGFHHWIKDVQDELPLGGIFEVPGNIGDGRRWGVATEITFPLDRLGISAGRIDLTGRYQDSVVDDPVTSRTRVLSDEGKYELRMNFRQTWNEGEFAWGGMIAIESEIPSFGLDEFIVTDGIDDTIDMDIFIETTRWLGVRTRLQFGNVFNRTFHRDRLVYTGPRDLSPLAFRELRNRTRGYSIQLSMTAVF